MSYLEPLFIFFILLFIFSTTQCSSCSRHPSTQCWMKGMASSPSLSMMWGAVAWGLGGWGNGVCSKTLTQMCLLGCLGRWWGPSGHRTGGEGEMVPAACSCTPINCAPTPWWLQRCWCPVLGAWVALGGLSSNLFCLLTQASPYGGLYYLLLKCGPWKISLGLPGK